jgi:tRNA (guanine-N7-)-methyltransferase
VANWDTKPRRPEINPYLELHRQKAEIVTAEVAPAYRGRWGDAFAAPAPLHLELGTGHGSWLGTVARARPDANWLGLEIRYKRCVQTAGKVAGLPNARVVRWSWFLLRELFAPGELAGLYVHHPDPWAKRSQERNRLFDAEFFEVAGELCAPGAELRVKTDHPAHADAILAALPASAFELLGETRDLGRDGAPWPDDVPTGYQARFMAEGKAILAVRGRRRE